MKIDMEVEDLFIRMLRQSAVQPTNQVPLLNKQLKGYVPDGRQPGIASARHLGGVDQFTEVKVIHNGSVQYNRVDFRDDPSGAIAVNTFQSQVREYYITHLRRRDQRLFNTIDRGALETVFRQIDFKPLVFGSFGEMSKGVKEYIELAVDYGAEHLGRTIAATIVEAVKGALRRRYKSLLSTANWRGLAKLVLDRTKVVGSGHVGMNRSQIRQKTGDRADQEDYLNMRIAHETDVPLRIAFPGGRMVIGEDAIDEV
jgi:hypothetical protein